MTDDITRAAALLRANGWTVLPPGKLSVFERLVIIAMGLILGLLMLLIGQMFR